MSKFATIAQLCDVVEIHVKLDFKVRGLENF